VGIGGACEGQSTLIVYVHDEQIIVVKVAALTSAEFGKFEAVQIAIPQ